MQNPKTTLEKADAAANYVQQMFLAHQVNDPKMFAEAHRKASELLADVIDELDATEPSKG